MKNLKILFVFIVIAYALPMKSQTIADKYNLNFKDITVCNRPWFSWGKYCKFIVDSGNTFHDKPALKVFYTKPSKGESMEFHITTTVILPREAIKQKCEVFITSKSEGAKEFCFEIMSLNKNEEVTSTDSIKIKNDSWETKSVSCNVANSRALRINIHYKGDKTPNQNILFDKVLIKVNNQDITQHAFSPTSDSLGVIKSLNIEKIQSLSIDNDSTLLANVRELHNKKIIGIGESTHGSSSLKKANYQFIKNLIVNNNCRMVLLEYPMDLTLTWNLFVQGKLSDDYQNQIIADAKCCFGDYEQLADFINWLRIYNHSVTTKVKLLGIDNVVDLSLSLFDYNLALLGKRAGAYYLRKISEQKYDDITTHSETHNDFKNILSEEDFKFYMKILKSEPLLIQNGDKNRDLNMFNRVLEILNIYDIGKGPIVIFTHSAHLNYQEQVGNTSSTDLPLGFYLRQKFKNRYFSISFQIGKGSYTQDKCLIFGEAIVDTLKTPPFYSFEYACLNTGVNYFFYLSKDIGGDILSYCDIGRTSRYSNLFQFCSLRKRFDAYVFIRESKAIDKIEPFPVLYTMDYLAEKRSVMNNLIKEMKEPK